jgi:hypothetical protein
MEPFPGFLTVARFPRVTGKQVRDAAELGEPVGLGKQNLPGFLCAVHAVERVGKADPSCREDWTKPREGPGQMMRLIPFLQLDEHLPPRHHCVGLQSAEGRNSIELDPGVGQITEQEPTHSGIEMMSVWKTK